MVIFCVIIMRGHYNLGRGQCSGFVVSVFVDPVERLERTFYLNERIINMCERSPVSLLYTDQCVLCQIRDSHYRGIYMCCVSITRRGVERNFQLYLLLIFLGHLVYLS